MPPAHQSYAADAEGGRETQDERTVLVRKLGSVDVPTYLERVLTDDGEQQFVVVERLSRGGMTEQEASESMRDARMAAALEHPNVVRTRAITVRADEISVTSDYVAGERLSELWSPASGPVAKLPLEIALRILVDVSTGLGALHKLRSAEGQERVKFVHGEVTASNVLVGLDGLSALLGASRMRRGNGLPKTGIGTLAPEILSGGGADQRADIYSLGALLWQALSGRPLFPDDDVDAILASAERETIARAVVTKDAPWALPLADVAARALAKAPEKRFPTASSMVTELRKIAGAKLATAEAVAQFVEATAGEKIAARLSDVQASAVIRKVASIPPPRSPLPPAPLLVERGSAPSKLPTHEGESAKAKPPIDAVTMPLAAPRFVPTEEMAPPASIAPRTETARPEAKPQGPAPSPARPTSALSQAAPAKPRTQLARAAEPRKVAQKGAAAAVHVRVATKASRAVLVPEPTSSPQWAMRLVVGASLAVTLLTAWLTLRGIRNRQEIVTPGAALLAPSAVPAPAASPVRREATPAPRSTPPPTLRRK